MTRAAVYARVSTEEQAERYGLAAQVRELRAMAGQRGYTVPSGAEYVDDGYSGADLDRPALTRLRDALRTGTYQVVLVHDPDRLSRRLAHQLLLTEEMQRHGVEIEFVTTPREATPEGNLLLNVKGVIAEYERTKIIERTMRGKREKARRGLVVASYPYGYRPDPATPGRLVVHEPEADVIRQMYAWLIDEQRSMRVIIEELRRQGIPSSRPGRQWASTQVHRILTSDRYTGRVYYGQRQNVGGKRRQRPQADWIPIPIPAIVTPERHAAAVAQLKRNRATLVGRPQTSCTCCAVFFAAGYVATAMRASRPTGGVTTAATAEIGSPRGHAAGRHGCRQTWPRLRCGRRLPGRFAILRPYARRSRPTRSQPGLETSSCGPAWSTFKANYGASSSERPASWTYTSKTRPRPPRSVAGSHSLRGSAIRWRKRLSGHRARRRSTARSTA